jgi:hypothetical protein
MARMWWKRRKTFAMLSNKRQWEREFDPTQSTITEIELEQGGYLVIESSVASSPTFIITENIS